MNILIIVDSNYYSQVGGKSTHVSILKKGLEKEGHSVNVLFPRGNFFTKIISGGGGRFLDTFGIGTFYRNFTIKILLKRLIGIFLAKNKVDVINAEDVISFCAVYELKKKIPVILTVHGELAQEMESAGYVKTRYEKELFLNMEKRAYACANHLIAVDTRLGQHIIGLSPSATGRLDVIQNFIDVTSFRDKVYSLNAEVTRKELKIDLGKKIVLVPRRLVLKCGVIYAIKAAEIIRDKFGRNDFFFVIAGDGPEKRKLLKYIQENNLQRQVFIAGIVEYKEMVKYYRIADVILVPSINVGGYKEATSLSVLEAMSAGVPVIASDLGGLAEIIDNEVTGILVPEKSPEDIADRILSILDHEGIRDKIVSAAFEYVSKNHSNEAAARKFIKIYTEESKKRHELRESER